MVENLSIVESQIRQKCLQKGLRISEFFLDYDRLRSGYVTGSQFFRILFENLQLTFTKDIEGELTAKYDRNNDGRIYYRAFCTTIAGKFDEKNLTETSAKAIPNTKEFFGSSVTVRPLSPHSEHDLMTLLHRMNQYYKYRGLDIRTAYLDADVHNIGKVTESQFYRSFPGPPDFAEEEMNLLVRKYRDYSDPGMVIYYNLATELFAVEQGKPLTGTVFGDDTEKPMTNGTTEDLASGEVGGVLSRASQEVDLHPFMEALPLGMNEKLQELMIKIMVTVHKFGIRTTEFYKDFDKLRSGNVTEPQFRAALTLALEKHIVLTPEEMDLIVNHYRIDHKRVRYADFVKLLENAFNIPHLDKLPTYTYMRPPEGALGRTMGHLNEEEIFRLKNILQAIADEVKKRRIMMYQYFKDFDRSTAYTRVMTRSQFSRVLHFLTLNVNDHDLDLLCKAFSAKVDTPSLDDVNYPAFVQAVDELFTHSKLGEESDIEYKSLNDLTRPPIEFFKDPTIAANEKPKAVNEKVELNQLIARIRHLILTKRVRIKEFVSDFDPLRSEHITVSQFRRVLSNLGLSKIGDYNLSDHEFDLLTKHYSAGPVKPDHVLWTRFEKDIDLAFTQPNLEKTPTHKVPPQEEFLIPKAGTMNWDYAAPDHSQLYEATMKRLRKVVNERRVLCLPVFEDFDKHNEGHVTRQRFRRALAILALHATEAELTAIEARFINDNGFNYREFLQDLQPKDVIEAMYPKRVKELEEVNAKKGALPERKPASNLDEVLWKIKNKIVRERIRLEEFIRDYDKLNSKRVLKTQFRRALDLCKLELTESEIQMLEWRYQSSSDAAKVEYFRFCDDIEAIFTIKHLDKRPTYEAMPFEPKQPWKFNMLDTEEELKLFEDAMMRIADKVRQHRMQLFPLFEDFDPVHAGYVSQTQFRRVLATLELNPIITHQENEVITKRFLVSFGGRDDVNYIAFNDNIYDLAGIYKRIP